MKKISILWLFAMIVLVSSCKEERLAPPVVPPHSYPSDVVTNTVSVNGVSFTFAEIKGATFKMGSSDGQSSTETYVRNSDSYNYLAFESGNLGATLKKEACYATQTYKDSLFNLKVGKVPANFALQTNISCNTSGDYSLTTSPTTLELYKIIIRARPVQGTVADGINTFDTDSAMLSLGSISSGDEYIVIGNRHGNLGSALTDEVTASGLKGKTFTIGRDDFMKTDYILLDYLSNLKAIWTFSSGATTPKEAKRFTNEDQHVETVQNFYMGTKEVTQAQFQAITGKNPSLKIGADLPVDNVTFLEAQEFIDKLNIAAAAFGTFSLPTEIQWEYACRAGSETPFYTGGCLSSVAANYYWFLPYGDCGKDPGITVNNGPSAIQAGGTYAPNAYGLYDMHGNVSEWCSNWLGNMYPNRNFALYPDGIPLAGGENAVIDPTTGRTVNDKGEDAGYNHKAIRGGSWNVGAEFCRSAIRLGQTPDKNTNFEGSIGLRLVFKPL